MHVLEKTDTKTLSRNEQFAFFINAYNAWTIKLILTAYPGIKSIKDLGSLFRSPWKNKIVRIEGDVLSLDNVEHDILRPRFSKGDLKEKLRSQQKEIKVQYLDYDWSLNGS